ncbi:MAG TPA: hypothetical protein VHE83_02695 [Mycobacteriales bacterium]|nr:hypothetical protein [Mycobacteriales bacterium]
MTLRTRATVGLLASATVLAGGAAFPAGAAPRGGRADVQTYAAVAVVSFAGGPGSQLYQLAVGPNGDVAGAVAIGPKRNRFLTITDVRGTTAVGTLERPTSGTDVVTVDITTGAITVIAHNGGSPVLSFNGQRVLYVKQSNSPKPGTQPILRVPVTGGAPQKVLSPPKGRNFDALATAQDGHTVYATASTPLQGGTQADFARLRPPLLYSFNAASPKLVRVTTKQPLYGVSCGTLVVDLAGQHIALGCNITQGDDPAVEIVTPAGGAVHRVPRKVGLRSVTAWSPNGQWIDASRANATPKDPFDLAQPFGTAHHKLTGLPAGTLVQSVTLVRAGGQLQPLADR